MHFGEFNPHMHIDCEVNAKKKTKTMKIIISALLMWLSVISAKIGGIWALVSYINYLVKDTPFNMNSLVFMGISISIFLVSLIYYFWRMIKES